MGYEFFCGIPVAVVAVLALVLGLFITLAQLEDWVADTPMRKAKAQPVSHVVADGEAVWNASQNDKQSLVEPAK